MSDIASSSDYNQDKIVRVYEGSFNKSTQVTQITGSIGDIYVYKIAHGLGHPFTADLIWSDGAEWVDSGGESSTGDASLAYTDDTFLYIISSLFAPSSGTRQYKVIGQWIPDLAGGDEVIPEYQNAVKSTLFDGNENYQKLIAYDELFFPPGTFGDSYTVSIPHNLGYKPNAKVYFEALPNEIYPANYGGFDNPFLYRFDQDELSYTMDDQNLTITMDRFSNATKKVYYRIYLDD